MRRDALEKLGGPEGWELRNRCRAGAFPATFDVAAAEAKVLRPPVRFCAADARTCEIGPRASNFRARIPEPRAPNMHYKMTDHNQIRALLTLIIQFNRQHRMIILIMINITNQHHPYNQNEINKCGNINNNSRTRGIVIMARGLTCAGAACRAGGLNLPAWPLRRGKG